MTEETNSTQQAKQHDQRVREGSSTHSTRQAQTLLALADGPETIIDELLKRPALREELQRRLAEPAEPHRLRLDKAKGDVLSLVKWLMERDPTAKLAAIVVDAIVGSDIEIAIKRGGGYDGDLGHDLRHDWEADVVRMIDAPDTPPADRAVAAWIMGAITVT